MWICPHHAGILLVVAGDSPQMHLRKATSHRYSLFTTSLSLVHPTVSIESYWKKQVVVLASCVALALNLGAKFWLPVCFP